MLQCKSIHICLQYPMHLESIFFSIPPITTRELLLPLATTSHLRPMVQDIKPIKKKNFLHSGTHNAIPFSVYTFGSKVSNESNAWNKECLTFLMSSHFKCDNSFTVWAWFIFVLLCKWSYRGHRIVSYLMLQCIFAFINERCSIVPSCASPGFPESFIVDSCASHMLTTLCTHTLHFLPLSYSRSCCFVTL